jgi:hypothetical protein
MMLTSSSDYDYWSPKSVTCEVSFFGDSGWWRQLPSKRPGIQVGKFFTHRFLATANPKRNSASIISKVVAGKRRMEIPNELNARRCG